VEGRRGGVRVSITWLHSRRWRGGGVGLINLALIYTSPSDYSAPSDRGPRKSRVDRALAVEELRRGGEAVGFVPSDRILVPPVDREGMRRNAGSAVECELRLRGGRCR
jgi:hypothetical protein